MSTPQELDQAREKLAETMVNLPNVGGEILVPSATFMTVAALTEAVGAILQHLADVQRAKPPW